MGLPIQLYFVGGFIVYSDGDGIITMNAKCLCNWTVHWAVSTIVEAFSPLMKWKRNVSDICFTFFANQQIL